MSEPTQTKLYSVYVDADCICEEHSREGSIKKATVYFKNIALDNMEHGEGEQEIKLLITNEANGNETIEDVTLEWYAETDADDGGAFDYNTSRGV